MKAWPLDVETSALLVSTHFLEKKWVCPTLNSINKAGNLFPLSLLSSIHTVITAAGFYGWEGWKQVLWTISSVSKWAGVSSSWGAKHELTARQSTGEAWGDSHTLASSLPPQKAHTPVAGDLPWKHSNPVQSQKIHLVQVGQGWRLYLQLPTYLYFIFPHSWDSSERRNKKSLL